jgi:hypothetical protein
MSTRTDNMSAFIAIVICMEPVVCDIYFAEQILLVAARKVISMGETWIENAKNAVIARKLSGIVCRVAYKALPHAIGISGFLGGRFADWGSLADIRTRSDRRTVLSEQSKACSHEKC